MPDINREFAELCGIHIHEYAKTGASVWKCSCGRVICSNPNVCGTDIFYPDFVSDPRLVLREMMKREDWPEFAESLRQHADKIGIGSMEYIIDLLLDQTGLLVKAAITWMEGMKG
jgi:hypothetical protein